jgi:hypothetical protein
VRGDGRVEQLGCEVAGDHVSAGARGGDRGVAGPGGNVQDLGSRADTGAVDDPLADIGHELGDPGVVARCPGLAVRLLEGLDLDGCGHGLLLSARRAVTAIASGLE